MSRNRKIDLKLSWLGELDDNGDRIGEYASGGKNIGEITCSWCSGATVNISNSGKAAIIQHASTAKHKNKRDANKDAPSIKARNPLLCEKLSATDLKIKGEVTMILAGLQAGLSHAAIETMTEASNVAHDSKIGKRFKFGRT